MCVVYMGPLSLETVEFISRLSLHATTDGRANRNSSNGISIVRLDNICDGASISRLNHPYMCACLCSSFCRSRAAGSSSSQWVRCERVS